MSNDRELVILSGAEKTKDPEKSFERFIRFALEGGAYMKLGRGKPKHARPGCKAYVVFRNYIVGALQYDGVDDYFEPGETLGGEEDSYTMDAGPALRFVGPYEEVDPPIPYRKGFRGWEYLPTELEGKIRTRKLRS